MLHPARRDLLHVEVRVDDLLFIPHSLTHRLPDQGDNFPPVATVNSDVKSELPLLFPLCYINPPVFTNSDKDKYKGAGHPMDVRFAPTVAKRRPQEVRWTSALCRPVHNVQWTLALNRP